MIHGRRGAARAWAALLGIGIGAAIGAAALGFVLQRQGASGFPAPERTPPRPAPTAPAAKVPKVDLTALTALLLEEAEKIRGTVSIHVRLEDGGHAGVRADEPQPAASVMKLPVMLVLFDAWATGQLTRTPKDEEAVRKAITLSDNPTADWLIDRLGMSQINTWLEEHGYPRTRLRHKMLGPRPEGPNVVTAAEMTRMLLEIARGAAVGPAASAEMREILLAQTRRTRIPAGVPEGVIVGNKTGTLRGITNDVAFVEAPGLRYAIAVLVSEGGPDASTSRAIAELARKVHRLLASQAAPDHPEPPGS